MCRTSDERQCDLIRYFCCCFAVCARVEIRLKNYKIFINWKQGYSVGRLQAGSWLTLLMMFTWPLCTVVQFLGSSCVSECLGALVSQLYSGLGMSNMGE